MSIYDEFGLNKTVTKRSNVMAVCVKLILFFFIMLAVITGFTNTLDTPVSAESVNLANISEPTQYKSLGGTQIEINNGVADITYVAEYSLSGRVVDVENYYGSYVRDKLSPKDIGVAWGFFATDESQDKVRWTSHGNRYLSWYISDGEWYRSVGGESAITAHHSNNHLIPANDDVEKLVKKIKKDDYVQVDGYLVNVYWKKNDGSYFRWNTSTTRNDDGNGACEIIYVTNVTWLK